MKKIYSCLLTAFLFLSINGFSQTPVPLASQPDYTYLETFADINSWTFSSSNNGTFTAGAGASRWRGIAVSGTANIPSGSRITTSTTAAPVTSVKLVPSVEV